MRGVYSYYINLKTLFFGLVLIYVGTISNTPRQSKKIICVENVLKI